MKKIKLLSLLGFLALSFSTYAQNTNKLPADSPKVYRPMPGTVKKDTVIKEVPVYIIQRTDTVRARILVVYDRQGDVRIERGFVFLTGMKDAKGNWLQQPAMQYMDAGYMPIRQEVVTAF